MMNATPTTLASAVTVSQRRRTSRARRTASGIVTSSARRVTLNITPASASASAAIAVHRTHRRWGRRSTRATPSGSSSSPVYAIGSGLM